MTTRKKGGGRSAKELRAERTFILQSTQRTTKKKGKITPRMILAFLSMNHEYLPSITEYGDYLIEDDIFRSRLILWESKRKQKTYADLAKKQKIPDLSEATLLSLLRKSLEKKYKTRGSPPFSSATLCGATLPGNDNKMYASVKNKAGVCTWIPQ